MKSLSVWEPYSDSSQRCLQVEEGWVQCDDCQGWVHQICGLFNKGNNKDDAAFHCPECLEEGLRMGRRQVVSERPQSMMESADLTQCDLSTVLQAHLDQVVEVPPPFLCWRAVTCMQAKLPTQMEVFSSVILTV